MPQGKLEKHPEKNLIGPIEVDWKTIKHFA